MSTIVDNRVIVFAKRPIPGQVKTRLAGLLGADVACRLYEAMLSDTLSVVGGVVDVRRVIACTPSDEVGWFASRYGRRFELSEQGEGDLGARLNRCFERAFSEGADRVVVVGSDLPTLTGACLLSAMAVLERHDVVLGPALDGGYYLLGLTRPIPELFRDIDWSTDRVLRQTVERAGGLGLDVRLLEAECDVDDEASLRTLVEVLDRDPVLSAPRTRALLKELDGRLWVRR